MKLFNADKLAKDLYTKRVGELGWNMAAAAKDIGTSKATICRLENKLHDPDVNTLFAVCKWLKKPMETYFN